MIPDVQQMSVIEIEHLVIQNAGRIKSICHGKITKKIIAMAMGVLHDEVQCRALFNKIPKLHCLKRAGSSYVFTVDQLYPGAIDVIEADPVMRDMSRIAGSMPLVATEDEVAFEFLASGDALCKYCSLFITSESTCSKENAAKLPESKACDEFVAKKTRGMEIVAAAKERKKKAREKMIKGSSRTSTA
jgi:hypothetical protein